MLADYQALVDKLVRDDAGAIESDDRDAAIGLAVSRYSKDRARDAVEDLTPTDPNTLPLPAGWQEDFSDLRTLEFPIGDLPPSLLDQTRYTIYQAPSGNVIRTIDAVTVAAHTVRAGYSIAHVVAADADSIPVADREPVACWAAAVLCDELASLYSGNTDSTIQAATVANKSKADEYAARAKSLRTRYLNEIGVTEQTNASAGVAVVIPDLDTRGQPRLTHSPAYRNRPW